MLLKVSDGLEVSSTDGTGASKRLLHTMVGVTLLLNEEREGEVGSYHCQTMNNHIHIFGQSWHDHWMVSLYVHVHLAQSPSSFFFFHNGEEEGMGRRVINKH